jgi:putative flippase GtrA
VDRIRSNSLFEFRVGRSSSAQILRQFVKFGLVGLSGVGVGLGVLNICMWIWTCFPVANVVAFLVAVSWNFLLNRHFTFERVHKPIFRQWLEFIIACLGGAGVNWTVSMSLYYTISYFHQHYNYAALIGVGVSSLFNFMASRYYVFQKSKAVAEVSYSEKEKSF